MGDYDYLGSTPPPRTDSPQSVLPASDDTSTVYDVDLGTPVAADQGMVLQVTRPDGSQYTPMTKVKNPAQAAAYGEGLDTAVPIMVPPDVDPQGMVNQWSNKTPLNNLSFAETWWPGGQNDYKNNMKKYGQAAPMFDAYGNFEYGATGAQMGDPSEVLTTAGHVLSLKKYRKLNDPINTKDIQSGADAITNGGKLSTIPKSQWRGP